MNCKNIECNNQTENNKIYKMPQYISTKIKKRNKKIFRKPKAL